MADMREWINKLDEAGELIRITKSVNIKTEMGALIWESRDKALLFENIVDYPKWKTLAQGPGTMKQIGLSLGVPATKAGDEYSKQLAGEPTACNMVETGPVKEIKGIGKDADLARIALSIFVLSILLLLHYGVGASFQRLIEKTRSMLNGDR